MSVLSQFLGGLRPPKSIVNYFSAGSMQAENLGPTAEAVHKKYLSGAVTANTYKEILAISGSGIVDLAAVAAEDATSRTVGIKVVIDGITAFDAISGTVAGTNVGIIAIGHWFPVSTYSVLPDPICFNVSLSISIKSSISETDKISLRCNYKTT